MPRAILVEKDEAGYRASLQDLSEDQFPEGDVSIAVEYSTINYKDALAITGERPVVRTFPMVPGIDLAGRVLVSNDVRYRPGDAVLVNTWGIGESHWGGLATFAKVHGDWIVPVPPGMSTRQSMAIGTAGYTAMLCIMALERHGITPDRGEILVTGAAGGVGSTAIALLSRLGYRVVAATGRTTEADYLRALGAAEIIDRSVLSAPGKPLASERWAGAIDSVGSHTLANVCASMRNRGVVTACGLAQGMDLPATVAPFIIRGVTLVGIDSVLCPHQDRLIAWSRLAHELDIGSLDAICAEINLSDACEAALRLLRGNVRGRLVVDVNL